MRKIQIFFKLNLKTLCPPVRCSPNLLFCVVFGKNALYTWLQIAQRTRFMRLRFGQNRDKKIVCRAKTGARTKRRFRGLRIKAPVWKMAKARYAKLKARKIWLKCCFFKQPTRCPWPRWGCSSCCCWDGGRLGQGQGRREMGDERWWRWWRWCPACNWWWRPANDECAQSPFALTFRVLNANEIGKCSASKKKILSNQWQRERGWVFGGRGWGMRWIGD